MSFFANAVIILPTIRLSISPTPIGRIPGFLSKGIRQHAKYASRDESSIVVVHIFLANDAMAFLRSSPAKPYTLDVKIRLHPSASRPEGPEPPFI